MITVHYWSRRFVRMAVLPLLLLNLPGCSDSQTDEKAAAVVPAESIRERVARSRRVGTPRAAAYLDGIVTLQTGPSPDQRESLIAPEAGTMLVAVLIEVDDGDQTFIPKDYEIEIDKEPYVPVGVSFDTANGVFFSVESLLTASVELTKGTQGRVGMADDRIARVELPEQQVILLYKSSSADQLTLFHGSDSFGLAVSNDADWIDISIPASTVAGLDEESVDEKLEVTVGEGSLKVIELQGDRAEVYSLDLKIRCPLEGVEVSPRNLYLNGPSGRTRDFLFEFDDQEMRMLAGSEYSDLESSEGPLRRIFSGGVRVGVHGGSLPLTVVFPDPPFEEGFDLMVAGLDPIELIGQDSALGEIRPAFAESLSRIPRAALIGKPAQVGYLTDPVPVVGENRRREIQTMRPGDGKRFLALSFDLDEGPQKLIANDYELTPDGGKSTRPFAVAVGLSPAEHASDSLYKALEIKRGETDRVQFRRGDLQGWEITAPKVILVWEIPAEVNRFRFAHGDTQLTLQPAASGREWRELRPKNARETLDPGAEQVNSSPPDPDNPPAEGSAGSDPAKPAVKVSEQDVKKAASLIRMAKLLGQKNPEKTRKYLQDAKQLAPGTELDREAEQLLRQLDD